MAFLKLNPSTAFAGCGEKQNSSTLLAGGNPPKPSAR